MKKILLLFFIGILFNTSFVHAQQNISMYVDYPTAAQDPNGYVWRFRSNIYPIDTMVLQYSGITLGVGVNRDTIVEPLTLVSYKYPNKYTIDSIQFLFYQVNHSNLNDTIGVDIVGVLPNGYPDLSNIIKREFIVTNNNNYPASLAPPPSWTNASPKFVTFYPHLNMNQKCAIMLRYNAPSVDTMYIRYAYQPGGTYATKSIYNNSFCNIVPYINNLALASGITSNGSPYYLQDQDWMWPFISFTTPPTTYSTITTSICNGNTYILGANAYTTSGTYNAILVNYLGGDSNVTLNLTVLNTSSKTINANICQGGSYFVGSTSYNTTGSYTNYLTNYHGCDSIVYLNLIVNPISSFTITTSICQGSSYSVGGNSYNSTGTFITHLTNHFGCDSAVNLNLTVKPTSTKTINATICQGSSYTVGSNNYNTTGTFVNHLTNYTGCDSAVTLNLTVKPTSTKTINGSICQGSNYTVGSTSYNTNGTFITHLTNYVGCDSAVTLNLTVKPNSAKTINAAICQGSSYTVGSNNYNTTGTFINHLTNYLGCDSAVTLNLVVNNPSTITINASICQGNSYTVGANTYSTSGTFINHFSNYLGCDSAVTLNLTVKPTSTKTINASICQGDNYTVGTTQYNTTGSYTINLTNYLGCDSTVTLNLVVNALPGTPTITAFNCDLICDSVGTSYQWYRAGVKITGATSQGYTINSPGFYSVEIGNAAGCKKTSAPVYFTCTNVGIEHLIDLPKMEAYPNPFYTNLTVNFNEKIIKGELIVLNSLGQIVKSQLVENTITETIDLQDLSKGSYYLQLKSNNNYQVIKITKAD